MMAKWFQNTNCARIGLAILVAAVGIGVAGCETQPVLGKVAGRITFQKQPVASAVVLFSNSSTGTHITATVDAQGEYIVMMAKGFGLPPGKYQVSINPPPVAAPMPTTGPIPVPTTRPRYPNIPQKYRKPESSGLTLVVNEGENCFDVDMQP